MDLFERFGSFLIGRPPSVTKFGTASSYVSRMRDRLVRRFGANNPVYGLLNEKWYKDVGKKLRKAFRNPPTTLGPLSSIGHLAGTKA